MRIRQTPPSASLMLFMTAPGTDESIPAASSRVHSASSSTEAAPANSRSRFSGVSHAASRPFEIISIVPHTACTSERMWLDSTTVCVFPNSFISSRISTICFGSSPAVGSSRMIISGLPSMACAMPSHCL